MEFNFQNKNVLVSGASRGIGRVTAQLFSQAGAHVIVHYNRNSNAAMETMEQLAGSGHHMVQADLADPAAIQQMVDTVAAQMGHLDVLVNNAGIFEEHPIRSISYDEWQTAWQETISVNLIGPANLTFCAVRQMRNQGGGRIVNVSSRGAFRGEPEAPAYGASKAGLNAMGQSLAKTLAPYNIFVHTVAPGFVETDMAEEVLNSPAGDEVRNQSPLGRVAQPEEVARTVLFLASEGSEFLTGAIVDVNGASYLRT
ncbi:MAG: SDR family oxidoreductase [Chloroflexota bacterium]